MSVSGVSGSSSSPSAKVSEAERAVIVLKKQQDAAKVQAQGLLDLIQQATPPGVGGRINTWA